MRRWGMGVSAAGVGKIELSGGFYVGFDGRRDVDNC
jgi:hypothetical protein